VSEAKRRSFVGARIVGVLFALALFGGACVAFIVAGVAVGLGCQNADASELAHCRRQGVALYVLASIGLVATLTLVIAAALQRRRLAALALAVGVPVYLVWGVLLDLSTHG
jgi:hypothetical protein